MKHCAACQQALEADARFCGFCGFRLDPLPRTRLAIDPTLKKTAAQPTLTVEDIARASTVAQLDQLLYEPGVTVAATPAGKRGASEAQATPSRRFQRYPMKIDLGLYSAHNFFSGQTENISAGGIFVATPEPAHLGDALELEFSLPGVDQPCRARCVVRWVRHWGEAGTPVPGMGLEFSELSPEVSEAIAAFLLHRKPLTSPTS